MASTSSGRRRTLSAEVSLSHHNPHSTPAPLALEKALANLDCELAAWCFIHRQFPRHTAAEARGLTAAAAAGETYPVNNIFSRNVPNSEAPPGAGN